MGFAGCIAQLVEQLTLNQWVQGSSPCASTKITTTRKGGFYIAAQIRREPFVTKLQVRQQVDFVSVSETKSLRLPRRVLPEGVPVRPPEINTT